MRKIGALALVLAAAGCVEVLDFEWAAQGIATTGGAGGQGGVGGAPFCSPGEKRECYTGPTETKEKGICAAGEEMCNAEGTAFGSCEGEVLPMPAEDCATPEDEDCDGQSSDCIGLPIWSQAFGDSFVQASESIATDGADNIAITGAFYGSIDFGGGALTVAAGEIVQGSDIFVAKLDSAGKHVFSRRFGDGFSQRARGIAMDATGDIALTGWFLGELDLGGGVLPAADDNPDIFVGKLDGSSGAHLWSRSIAGDPGAPEGYAVTFDPAGNVVLTGSFASSIDLGSGLVSAMGGSDAFVAKLDGATGAILWSKTFGDASDQAGHAVASDQAGNILLVGTFTGSVDFGGGPLTSTGSGDRFVAKLDPAGNHLWSKAFGESGSDKRSGATVDALGNVIVVGAKQSTAGDMDIFVAKLDPAGNETWSRVFGDSDKQQASSIDTDKAGNISIGGSFLGTIDFGSGNQITNHGGADMFLAKLDPSGDCLWSRRYGDDEGDDQLAVSVAIDETGNVCATGSFFGSMDVGPTTLMSAGLHDVLVMKLSP